MYLPRTWMRTLSPRKATIVIQLKLLTPKVGVPFVAFKHFSSISFIFIVAHALLYCRGIGILYKFPTYVRCSFFTPKTTIAFFSPTLCPNVLFYTCFFICRLRWLSHGKWCQWNSSRGDGAFGICSPTITHPFFGRGCCHGSRGLHGAAP